MAAAADSVVDSLVDSAIAVMANGRCVVAFVVVVVAVVVGVGVMWRRRWLSQLLSNIDATTVSVGDMSILLRVAAAVAAHSLFNVRLCRAFLARSGRIVVGAAE